MYDERIVIFIDILGFKNLVESKSFKEVNAVYDEFARMIRRLNEQINSGLFYAKLAKNLPVPKTTTFKEREDEIIYFSDCIIWSYPMSQLKDVPFFVVINDLCMGFHLVQNLLFSKGILVRGGVTVGQFHQDKNKVFGQGLIDAYLLEGQARYPRLALDKDMICQRVNETEFKRVLRHFLTYNIKGFFVHNFFFQCQVAVQMAKEGDEVARNMLEVFIDPIISVVKAGKEIENPNIREKYEWMRKKLIAMPDLGLFYNLKEL